MYPSSTSSSSQNTTGPSSGRSLERYGSAPSSLFTNAVDSIGAATRDFSVLGGVPTHQPHLATARFFPSESNSESTTMSNQNENSSRNNRESREDHHHSSKANTTIGLQRNYGFGGSSSSSPLVRHSSSPAGFLNQLATAASSDNNGFSISKGMGSFSNNKAVPDNSGRGISRLSSQLSFTRGQEPLSRIYEESETGSDGGRPSTNDHSNGHRKQSYPNTGFSMGPWDDSNATMFAVGTSKRAKHDGMEPHQFQFSIPQAALEMASMENLLHIPQDSVPCKIRAKRGFATHPRSIAERERRTRISGKLKKLQDLVPNMDKQTSYSDMLDLAVQHIKSLQNQLQKLNKDLDNCTCGCKKNTAENS